MKLHVKILILSVLTTTIVSCLILFVVFSSTQVAVEQQVKDTTFQLQRELESIHSGYKADLSKFASRSLALPVNQPIIDNIEEVFSTVLEQKDVISAFVYDDQTRVLVAPDRSSEGKSLLAVIEPYLGDLSSGKNTGKGLYSDLKDIDYNNLMIAVIDNISASGEQVDVLDYDSLTIILSNINLNGKSMGGIMVLFDSTSSATKARAFSDAILERISSAIRGSTITAIVVCLLIIIVNVLLASLFANRLIRPLRSLNSQMRQLGSGAYDLEKIPQGKDEVGDLGRTFISMIEDLRHTTVSRDQYRNLAETDPLTGIANRHYFEGKIHENLLHCQKHNKKLALFVIDLDDFKQINDLEGHNAGDRVLVNMAASLRACIRRHRPPFEDVACRIGGDEFTMQLSGIDNHDDVIQIAERILRQSRAPQIANDSIIRCGCSIGVAVYPEHGDDYQTLLNNADAALYQVKRQGKGGAILFNEEIARVSSTETVIHRMLNAHFSQLNMWMEFQPQIDLKTGEVVSAEALLRITDDELGRVNPAEFIAIAERCGKIIDVDKWVVNQVIHQVALWRDTPQRDLKVAINISSKSAESDDFADFVIATITEKGVLASTIEIEITEGLEIDSNEAVFRQLEKLRRIGVQIAIDDFGTGYSNLRYLLDLRAGTLKIDRSFIIESESMDVDEILLRSMIDLAENLGMQTVAEGIETESVEQHLRSLGCTLGQGYYYSPSLPPDALEQFIEKRRMARRSSVIKLR